MEKYYAMGAELFELNQTPSADGVHYLQHTGEDALRNLLGSHGFAELQPLHAREHSMAFTEGDPLYTRAHTMGVPYVSAKDGVRQSTASVFLPNAMQRDNFDYLWETTVLDIVHDAGRASGVRCVQHGVESQVSLNEGHFSTDCWGVQHGEIVINKQVGE